MRILFFTNEYSHPKLPNSGGVGSFLKIVAEALAFKGHEIHVYGFSKKPIEFTDKGIRFMFFKKYSKQFWFKEFIRSISSKLGLKNFDIRFLEGERNFYAKKLKSYCEKHQIQLIESFVFNGFTAKFDNSIPLVLRFHGSRGFWHHYLGGIIDGSKVSMEKRALEVTPYTVANSYFAKAFIKDYYNVDVDTVIPNGIDIDVFSPKPEIPTKPNSIYYIGTMSEAKGVKDLAIIFNKVVTVNPDATLHLIGRGEHYWQYLKSEVLSPEALKNTTYFNHLPLSKIPQKLSEASVIAVPSKGETFGFTIVEAMALEKVTIVSDIPVAKEIIDHEVNGLIAKDNDDFASLILKVLSEPKKYEDLRKNARRKVLNNFTHQRMTEETVAYYKKILNQH